MDRKLKLLKKHRELLICLMALAIYCGVSFFVHIPCPIKWVTGVSCPGCGMTRALLSVCRLDIQKALYYHPMVFYIILVAPILLVLHLKDKKKACKILTTVSALFLVIFYLYRIIFIPSPVVTFAPENGIFPRLIRWISNHCR